MTSPETTFVAEPGSHEFTITAVVDAPREAVYRAYTEPELLTQWWGPAELTTTIEKLEVKQGGVWRFVHTDSEGNTYGFHGVYHEVQPERIVQTFEFEGVPGHVSLQTATFTEADGRTTITEHAVFQSVADRDGMKAAGAEAHAPVGMAQLAAVLENLRPATPETAA